MPEKFVSENSFHDSYITGINYDKNTGCLKMNLVQLYSELQLDNSLVEGLNPDDLVELELIIEGVNYISEVDFDYSEYEILNLLYSNENGCDELVFQLHIFSGYEEIYIKGNDIGLSAQNIKRVDYE